MEVHGRWILRGSVTRLDELTAVQSSKDIDIDALYGMTLEGVIP